MLLRICLIIAILVDVKVCLIVCLLYISLKANNVKHLSVYLLDILSSLFIYSFIHLLIGSGDQTQGCSHSRQDLCNCAIYPYREIS
jgi:hypothetical protein